MRQPLGVAARREAERRQAGVGPGQVHDRIAGAGEPARRRARARRREPEVDPVRVHRGGQLVAQLVAAGAVLLHLVRRRPPARARSAPRSAARRARGSARNHSSWTRAASAATRRRCRVSISAKSGHGRHRPDLVAGRASRSQVARKCARPSAEAPVEVRALRESPSTGARTATVDGPRPVRHQSTAASDRARHVRGRRSRRDRATARAG